MSSTRRCEPERCCAAMHGVAQRRVLTDAIVTQVGLWVSSFEVYRDGIYDLLLPSSEARNKEPGKRRVPLKIGEDGAKRAFVKGLLEVPVHSADEAHRLLCLARANQTTAETQLGGRAVRSHLVLTVRMATSAAPGDDDQGSWGVSVLTFIELVSSEKPAKAGGDGSLLREAGHINASLLVLGRCMEAVGLKETSKKGPVPFRDSRLTQVFRPPPVKYRALSFWRFFNDTMLECRVGEIAAEYNCGVHHRNIALR
ncbi:hypothetical protein V5799_018709 [Amblyomma americanum]|uniref:Kinesin motor domain-containing protein n=1 Tax=Amblyomma americanum TaxID=6943 RepID=A0AAQ4EYY0_AMBAM